MILFDVTNKRIGKMELSYSNCYYIRGLNKFNIKLLEDQDNGDMIYTCFIDNANKPIIKKNKEFKSNGENNYEYTIFLKSPTVRLLIDDTDILEIELYQDDNISNKEKYNNLLINYNLPNYDELTGALFDKSKSINVIKRLLLDYQNIFKSKGNLQIVEKFFNLVGLKNNSLNIVEEYETPDKSRTLTPNKLQDIKTGDYQIQYNNYTYEGLNYQNLPINIIQIKDFDEFTDSLINSIILANKYFLIEEQEIKFFGLNFISNNPIFQSLTSSTNIINYFNVRHFEKDINIEISKYISSVNKDIFVNHNLVTKDLILYNSEVKIINNTEITADISLIDNEIFDDTTVNETDLKKVMYLFGSILHINIDSPNTYVEMSLINNDSTFIKLNIPKQYIQSNKIFKIYTKYVGNYSLKINIYDCHNNRETYYYDFKITNETQNMDFKCYSSLELLPDDDINILSTDIDSSIELNETIPSDTNYSVLPNDLISDDLSNYFNYPNSVLDGLRKISLTNKYKLPLFNMNYQLDKTTDTIPLKYIDNFISYSSFNYDPAYKLMLKIDDENGFEKYINYNELKNYQHLNIIDNICINILDVVINPATNQKEPYYIITTVLNGISLIKELYDFVLVSTMIDTDPESLTYNEEIIISEKSIYELPEYNNTKLDINYDFKIELRQSELVPTFQYYLSENFTVISTLYTRLKERNDMILKYGDFILCNIDSDTITDASNIVWEVYNSFTGELLHKTKNEYSLKYRINERINYNIVLKFMINDTEFILKKKSIFNSFTYNYI